MKLRMESGYIQYCHITGTYAFSGSELHVCASEISQPIFKTYFVSRQLVKSNISVLCVK